MRIFILKSSLLLNLLILLTAINSDCLSEHPIDVEKAYLQGRYFDALKIYQSLPSRQKSESIRRMALESAWSLGLPEVAITEINELISYFPTYSNNNPDIFLVKALIEYQEGQWDSANKNLALLQSLKNVDTYVRGESYGLSAEIARRQGDHDLAYAFVKKSLELLPPEAQGDIRLVGALCLFNKGDIKEAKKLIIEHTRPFKELGRATRLLGSILLSEGDYQQLNKVLLSSRKANKSELDKDSWIDYALIKVAIANEDKKSLNEIIKYVNTTYPESDGWRVLLEAEVEKYLASKI